MSAPAPDPITQQIVGNALASIADEMATTIFRTAHSTVVRDGMDFSAALCDRGHPRHRRRGGAAARRARGHGAAARRADARRPARPRADPHGVARRVARSAPAAGRPGGARRRGGHGARLALPRGGTYRTLAAFPAIRSGGLGADPGRPAILWLTCTLAALLLAGVLVGPLLRRTTGEQPHTRQDRRGAAARSGADLALVVLAGIALWQLRSYRTPVGSTSGGIAESTPAGRAPALVLLAGAVLALRLVPIVTHVGERLAARSRAWVSPLAVWELGGAPRA